MTIRRLLLASDEKDEAILRRKCKKAPSIDRGLLRLVDDMLDTLYEQEGVGLAAPQVGVSLRVIVMHLPDEEEPKILINPQVVKASGEMIGDEACLSIPGYLGQISRYSDIIVKALDTNGRMVRYKASGDLFSRALQHEMDHLDGILYYDHLAEGQYLQSARRADELQITEDNQEVTESSEQDTPPVATDIQETVLNEKSASAKTKKSSKAVPAAENEKKI